jgi:hypothetical protein
MLHIMHTGRSIKISTNSPSPTKQLSFQSVEERVNVKFQASMAAEDNPSTRSSKDNKSSPTPIVPKAGYKAGHSLDRSTDGSEHSTEEKGNLKVASFAPSSEHSQFGHGHGAGAGHDEDYMSAFKSLIDASPSKQGQKQFDFSEGSNSSKKLSPKPLNAADLLLQKRPTAESERENAERVDALLFELFPERFQKQEQVGKKTKGKVSKKASALALAKEIAAGAGVGIGAGAAAGYNKNQVKLSVASAVSTLSHTVRLTGCTVLSAVHYAPCMYPDKRRCSWCHNLPASMRTFQLTCVP